MALGILGFLLFLHWMFSDAQAQCQPGELCVRKPPGDWKLRPYNGLDKNSPIRKRFLAERNSANNVGDSNSRHFGTPANENEDDLSDFFYTKTEEKVKIVTKTEVQVKEVFVPQPCDLDLTNEQQVVRNCLTNDVIGKIPPGLELRPFDPDMVRIPGVICSCSLGRAAKKEAACLRRTGHRSYCPGSTPPVDQVR